MSGTTPGPELSKPIRTAVHEAHQGHPETGYCGPCAIRISAALGVVRPEVDQRDEEIERLRAELAEWTTEQRHQAFSHCDQGVGHVTMAAFGVKISEKVNAAAQRDEATRYANEQLQRAEQAEAVVKQHEDLLASIALYIKWHYVTGQLTTPQKELFADALERNAFRAHGPEGEEPDPEMAGLPSYAPRWWQTESEDQFKDQPADSKEG